MTLIKVNYKLNSLNTAMDDYEMAFDNLGWNEQVSLRNEQFRKLDNDREIQLLEDEIVDEDESWNFWEDLEDDDL
jgi:hypothetical protein